MALDPTRRITAFPRSLVLPIWGASPSTKMMRSAQGSLFSATEPRAAGMDGLVGRGEGRSREPDECLNLDGAEWAWVWCVCSARRLLEARRLRTVCGDALLRPLRVLCTYWLWTCVRTPSCLAASAVLLAACAGWRAVLHHRPWPPCATSSAGFRCVPRKGPWPTQPYHIIPFPDHPIHPPQSKSSCTTHPMILSASDGLPNSERPTAVSAVLPRRCLLHRPSRLFRVRPAHHAFPATTSSVRRPTEPVPAINTIAVLLR